MDWELDEETAAQMAADQLLERLVNEGFVTAEMMRLWRVAAVTFTAFIGGLE